jgi:hypothetical protein
MSSAPLADIVAEAHRLVDTAAEQQLTARVLGGAGVALHDHTQVPESLLRTFGDIDIVVPAKATRATGSALTSLGYQPNERFNALHGARRMLFYDTGNGRQLDVFVGTFAMCHELDLGKRLNEHPHALDAADLLLTKLQIAEINRKDIVDALRIMVTHEVNETSAPWSDPGPGQSSDSLSLNRLRDVTSSDWGWYTTFTDNLDQVRTAAPELLDEGQADLVLDRVDAVRTALEQAPKSMRWRARSVIGRKSAWYELPEEVDRGAAR